MMSTASRDREKSTLARQISGAFAMFATIVAAAGVATAVLYAISWFWQSPRLERSHLAMRDQAAAYAGMLDQVNAIRGYLLTHDAQFLESAAQGRAELARANRALAGHMGSPFSGELAAAMVRTRLAEERWQDLWANVALDSGASAATPSLSEGKALFDQYRREQAAFGRALSERRDRLYAGEQRITSARVLFELVVFGAILFLAVRQHRKLRSAIVDPVAALLRHIRRIRDGELQATADPVGPRELAELAEGLNEMVGALGEAREMASSRDDALRDHSKRLRQILEASREFSESLNLKYVVTAVRASTAAVGGYDHVVVWLMNDEKKRLVDSAGEISGNGEPPPRPSDAPSSQAQTLAGRAAKSGRITFEGPVGEVRFAGNDTEAVNAIAIPLIVGARVVGVLEARHIMARDATADIMDILEMLATHAATAIESARLHEVVEERSHVDALTRLLNRRRLDEDLEAECRRSTRYGRPMTLVMLDVDHFKVFNDVHGHPAADRALQEVSTVILGCVRTTDTAYRYGGEEFCVILRETTGDEGMVFAERVRMRIEQRFVADGMPGITASFGVASFGEDASTPRTLLEAADAAMYASKHAGRNRVMLSSRPPLLGSGSTELTPH
jgi:diguanylate cyclase (GGDEF)-like protein